ncbi:MAG TPA: glycosyltransferase, partial [Flavisolibacter sp.]|nr:glycosyltransferase [Flavisolibacter sp.]
MPRFAAMLAEGMKSRGHAVSICSPRPYFFRLPFPAAFKKWLGYIDQYFLFPMYLRQQVKRRPDTLFVFTDHALGPWIPLVKNRNHIIHCHDFLAQYSALGKIKETSLSFTGTLYQAYIRRGFLKGKNFISVSQKTQRDLHHFFRYRHPVVSKVVYNGLNQKFTCCPSDRARAVVAKRTRLALEDGYILHVGGNSWYKNRMGVIEIYNAFRQQNPSSLPLLLIGERPSAGIVQAFEASPYQSDIHFLPGIEDQYLGFAYAGASVLLFPSLAEGFGWPIAEAMACGCPVITTNETPMTEVAGKAGFLIEKRPADASLVAEWAMQSARVVKSVIELSPIERADVIQSGLEN